MKYGIPDEVLIDGKPYTVRENPELGDMGLAGRCNYWDRKIELTTDPAYCGPPDRLADTLLHEVLHGCYRDAQIPGKGCKEEELVSRLTPMLLTVIRDNPKLITALRRMCNG